MDRYPLIEINSSLFVENCLDNVELFGIGTNLNCYGSIVPTNENLTELSVAAEKIEKKIFRKLEIVSGGATTVLPALGLFNNVTNRI